MSAPGGPDGVRWGRMPRRRHIRGRAGPGSGPDPELDPEGPSADDLERFADESVACRRCGAEVSDLADSCPVCGASILGHGRRVPAWFVLAAALALVAFVLAYVI